MSLDGQLTLKEKVRRLPDSAGVYLMKDSFGQVVYIGKAVSLKRRVSQYFNKSYKHSPKIASLVKIIADFDFVKTVSDAQAVMLESKLIKQWKPKYNTLLKDDKRFLLLRVTMFEDLPRFLFVRQAKQDNCLYFGPYLSGSYVRSTLQELKKNFGIILSDAHPKKISADSWQIYDDARAQISNFENTVTKASYLTRVEKALEFLRGKDSDLLATYEEKMRQASIAQEFESAAKYRDIIFAMNETLYMNKTRKSRADISRSPKDLALLALEALKEALRLDATPRVIECFDISHISGSFVVASMVRFENGLPARQKYRRFKIKSFTGNDDFRAMNEVVLRRYKRLKEEKQPIPDIILIDGGKGQVAFALAAFRAENISPNKLVGLAKKAETIVLENGQELLLDRRNEGLKLFQRVRDEAHRFANSFSENLRSKKIKESVLDDFSGLGEKRKASILDHFGSIAKVKAASLDELAAVEGIGKDTAKRLFEFLKKISK